MKSKGSKLSVTKFGEDPNCPFYNWIKARYANPISNVDGKPFYLTKRVKEVGFVPVFEDIPDFAKSRINAD